MNQDTDYTIEELKAIAGPPNPQMASPRPVAQSRPMPSDAASLMPALIQQESGGRAGVRGPMTQYGQALGLTQMLPETAREMAGKVGVPYRDDLLTGQTEEAANYQRQLGQAYLEQGFRETGNARDALRYYHGGPNRRLWGPKTNAYADQVLGRVGQSQPGQPTQAQTPVSSDDYSVEELRAIANGNTATNPGMEALVERPGRSRDAPFVITNETPRELLNNLEKGTWIQTTDGQGNVSVNQLSGRPYINQNGPQGDQVVAGGNAYLHTPGIEDAARAFTSAAAEQVPLLDEAAVGASALLSGEDFSTVRDRYQAMQAVDNDTNRGMRDLGGIAGFGATMLAPGSGVISQGNRVERLAKASGVGLAYGGLAGAGSGEGDLGERLSRGAQGAAVGAIAGGVTQRFLGVPKAAGEVSPQRLLSREGVQLTPGQMAGGLPNQIEQLTQSVPIMGNFVGGARRRGFETLNVAVGNRALAPIGERVDEGVQAGRGLVRHVYDKIDNAYNSALDPVTNVRPTADLNKAVARARAGTALVPAARESVNSVLDNTIGMRFRGQITGKAWKELDEEIGAAARAARDSGDVSARYTAKALEDVQDALLEALRAANPAAAEAVQKADEAFANYIRLEVASASQEAASRGGVFTPAQLNASVRRSESGSRNARYSRSDALMQDLSDAAAQVLPQTVPDSGTALRGAFAGGLGLAGATGVGAIDPLWATLAAGATGVGAAAYTKVAQNLVNAIYRMTDSEKLVAVGRLRDLAAQNPALVPFYQDALRSFQGESRNQSQPTAPQGTGQLVPNLP